VCLAHILPVDWLWRSWWHCCLFSSYFARRLAVAKLVAALLSTQLPGVNPALAATDTLNLLLDLFFKYSLNNFLHAQVPTLFFFNTVWMHICLRRKTVDSSVSGFGFSSISSSRSRSKKAKIVPKEGKMMSEELQSLEEL
jgi:hypothetical protein